MLQEMGRPMTWLDRLLSGGFDPLSSGDITLEILCSGLPEEDAWALREERAGILEHLAGLSRSEAEARAKVGGRAPPSRESAPF